MAAKFVVKKGTTGTFRFSLLSTNGHVVARSEAYNTKASAMGGIRSVQKLAADAAVEDQTTREWAAGEATRKGAATAKKAAARTAAAAKRAGAAAKASSSSSSKASPPKASKAPASKASPSKGAGTKATAATKATGSRSATAKAPARKPASRTTAGRASG